MATATGSETVLGRKLAAARAGDKSGTRSALRALRLALARAGSDLIGLPLAVIGATQRRSPLENLPSLPAGDWLHMLLDGPEGRTGGLSLDRAFVMALVQQQTTGQVSSGELPDRPFTATDAALTTPLMNMMLARSAKLAEASADHGCLEGFQFGARMEEMRTLLLALDADQFRVFDLTVEIAAGVRQGVVHLVLPDAISDSASDEAATVPKPEMERAFGVLRAEMMAVIGQVRLPLSKLSGMRPGDMLPLTQGRMDQTDLVAINGRRVVTGKLGQSGGMRAVRLGDAAKSASEAGNDRQVDFTPRRPIATTRSRDEPEISPPEAPAAPASPGSELVVSATDRNEADEFERHLMNLSPEQAAAEISELAGLPLDDGESSTEHSMHDSAV